MRHDKRTKGNRVIHANRGGVYHGDVAERPRGLTTEQAEDQRVGTRVGARQSKEAAQRVVEAKPRKIKGSDDFGGARRRS